MVSFLFFFDKQNDFIHWKKSKGFSSWWTEHIHAPGLLHGKLHHNLILLAHVFKSHWEKIHEWHTGEEPCACLAKWGDNVVKLVSLINHHFNFVLAVIIIDYFWQLWLLRTFLFSKLHHFLLLSTGWTSHHVHVLFLFIYFVVMNKFI